MKIIFATNNHNKTREICHLLGSHFELMTLSEAGIYDDIPEDEPTLSGNAMHKARYVFERTRSAVFADDTGLEVDSLGGLPGVKSARFAGDAKNSDANIEKLLGMLDGKQNRKARFRTVIALIIDGKEHSFEGTVEGEIIKEKRGSEGFGYDPVFVPEGGSQTFAEMTLDEKSRLSHRARAFAKLKEFLSSGAVTDNKRGI